MKTDGGFLDLLLSQRDGKPKMTVGPLHPLCSFLPGAGVHSIRLILCKQVSQCSQKFKPVSSHLAAGNISKSDLRTEVLAGKGSSAAPSSPTYQRLRRVPSSTRASLPLHTMQAQHRPTLLFPYHCFHLHLSTDESIRTGEEMTCAIPAQPLQHATPALAAQESSPTFLPGNWQ